MYCPNENTPMHQAAVSSHYGQQVTIDQCGSCGGIWFDAFELYKVRQGEAEKIEQLDATILRAPSHIGRPTLLCPRDQTELTRFDDPHFPKEIILARCPKCQGFWLNRGEFTKYQEARQKLMLPKKSTPEDLKLEENVKRMLASHRDGISPDILGKVGKFLSTPVGEHALFPNDSSRGEPEESAFYSVLGILISILRLFVFR
jgi:Zn-finger nucleic acid-binding protein